MYTGVVQDLYESRLRTPSYPEFAGARVLVSGLRDQIDLEVAAAFAEQGARLLIRPDATFDSASNLDALRDIAAELHVIDHVFADRDDAIRFSQRASGMLGSLDVAVNLIPVDDDQWRSIATPDDLEAVIAAQLDTATAATRVLANRMGLTWSCGTVINVLRLDGINDLMAMILRAALAAATRSQAVTWAESVVNINAVAVRNTHDSRDLTRTALRLASNQSRALTGLTFDAR